METIAITSIVGIILFAVGVFCGKSSPCHHDLEPLSPYFCTCGCGGNWCYKTHCTPDCWKHNCIDLTSGKTVAQAEAEIKKFKDGYERGFSEGTREGVYNSSRSRHEEFMVKFKDGLKPLEDLKKEYKL